ncbi:MAG: polymer-forming cytoskeletal protein [Oscillospiraceae bacterium]|nr:polymer-forming cytoskeletal protein [Oscillospiraceae bacterium]
MVVLALLIAAAAVLFLCLRRTEKVLKERRRIVLEAAAQLRQAQQRSEKKQHSHKTTEVLARSHRIYTQAITLYEQTLSRQACRPWAALLGYGPLGEDGLPIYTAPLWRRRKRHSPKQEGETEMKTNNMKRAVFEMFGVGHAPNPEVLVAEEKKTPSEVMVAHPADITTPAVDIESEVPAVPTAAPVVSLRPVSYLAADTQWEGNLRSDGDVEVAGTFLGDIHAKGSVILRSTVKGNIHAGALQLVGCTLTGDSDTAEMAVVSEDSRVEGSVTAHDLRCAGTVIGDIAVSGHITLEHTACISGSIVTGSISVAKGATICGSVEIKSE